MAASVTTSSGMPNLNAVYYGAGAALGRKKKAPKKYFGKNPKTKVQKQGKVHTVMGEFKRGSLHSGKSKKKVTSRKQAVAIAMSEAGLSKDK